MVFKKADKVLIKVLGRDKGYYSVHVLRHAFDKDKDT